eukprot:8355564-Lingulodinium_polyedra.AAC.1
MGSVTSWIGAGCSTNSVPISVASVGGTSASNIVGGVRGATNIVEAMQPAKPAPLRELNSHAL